jgi:hypothetical protein
MYAKQVDGPLVEGGPGGAQAAEDLELRRVGRVRGDRLLAPGLQLRRRAEQGRDRAPDLAQEREGGGEGRVDLGRAEVEEPVARPAGEGGGDAGARRRGEAVVRLAAPGRPRLHDHRARRRDGDTEAAHLDGALAAGGGGDAAHAREHTTGGRSRRQGRGTSTRDRAARRLAAPARPPGVPVR